VIAGGDGREGREGGLGAAEGEVMELELNVVAARVLGDERVDRVGLVRGARNALKVVEDRDRHRRVGVAEPVAVLADAAEELLLLIAALDPDDLRATLS